MPNERHHIVRNSAIAAAQFARRRNAARLIVALIYSLGRCSPLPIVVAEENAFVFEPEKDRPFEREFLQIDAAQNNTGSIAIFTLQTIAELVLAAADGRVIESIHLYAESVVGVE